MIIVFELILKKFFGLGHSMASLTLNALTWILLLAAMIFLIEVEMVHGRGTRRTATVRGCTNETVYLSNDWRMYRECCSLLYPYTPCRLAHPCRNGGVVTRDGGRCYCKPGWRGLSCLMPCAVGYYGQGCSKRCKCGEGAGCDPMTGVCSCLDRDRCVSRCRRNYWGTTCQHHCNCKTGCQCDADTGECLCRSRPPRNRVSSPANMYLGALTQAGFLNICGGECMNGGTCKSNGVCRCRNGFIGTFCDSTCPGGTYGRNCQETCQCSSTAKCLPDTGLCMCLGYSASSSQSGGDLDSDEDESDSEYDEDSSASDIDEFMNPLSSSSSYSMYHCTGRCPVGRYGPYCRQNCNCPAGLLCNDVSGNCECPEGEVCDGSSRTTTQRDPVVASPPRRKLPVTASPARANPAKGSSGRVPAPSGPRTGTDTASHDTASSSSSSSSSHSVSTTGSKYPAADPNDGTSTSKAAKPEIALQGGDTATSEERLARGETLTLWAVIAVSSLLLLVVASVLIGILIKRQHQGSTVHVEGTHKKRLEDTNVYEIVESTNGRYRSNSKTIDKLAKKARERAESFKAQDSISSITKEIYLLRTSSLSNMTTLEAPRKDSKATEVFANWANSLRLNKSTNSLNDGSSSPGSSRSRSSSNTVTQPYVTKTVTPDNDFDDYAEPVDHVSTLSKEFPSKRPLAMSNSDSKCSDRGYQSLYTSSSSNASSNRTSYKPTEDSDYDELEEEVVDQDKPKQFRFTRSYTYSAPSKGQKGEYSCLNRGVNTGNRLGPDDKQKTSRGNTGYSSAVKAAETDGEYSHLNRSAKRLTHIPTKRAQAPTLRHDEEDDYDYLEAHKTDSTKTNGNVQRSDGKVENRRNLPMDGEYDLLHRQFRARDDQYESIWPGKK